MAKANETRKTPASAARPTTPRRAPVRKPPARSPIMQWAWEWVKSIGTAVVLFLIIRTFLFQTFTVISGSMERTLLVSDWLLLSKAAYGATIPGTSVRLPGYAKMQRSDIVVFRPPHDPTIDVVKRIVGIAGDTLEMRNQVLYINGKLASEPYVQHTDPGRDDVNPVMEWQRRYLAIATDTVSYRPSRDNWGPIIVPPNRFFMMGDNRDESLDSRYWGFLDPAKVKGRASFIYYSYDSQSMEPFPWIREIRWNRIGMVIR
jgi:signal peptidase I